MCSKGLAKFILFGSNFILFIAGGILLGFGIAGKVDPAGLQKALSNIPGTDTDETPIDIPALIANSASFMIAVGCFLFIFCFLGCFGACCEITWMLFLYWVALLIIIALEIALIIFAVVSPSRMKEEGLKLMRKKFNNYKPERVQNNGTVILPTDPISLSWFAMQSELDCCGVEKYGDYEQLKWNDQYTIDGKSFKAKVPPSCCLHLQNDVSKTAVDCMKGDDKLIHSQGCYEAVEKEVKKYNYIPIVICVVVIIIELISISAAIYLWREHKRGHMSV